MGIGFEGTPFYLPDPRDPDALVDFVYAQLMFAGATTALLAREIPRAAARASATRILAAGGSRAAMFRLGLAEIGGWPTVSRGFATFMPIANAFAVGYIVGAVVGTVITTAIWGEEGGNQALDFYTGEGHYWDTDAGDSGYFNIPKNFGRIWDYYMG